jgi:HEPN domain-containing protein
MTPRPASHARTLLKLSRSDAQVLESSVDLPIKAFHGQQAIEKAIKAIFTAHGVDYPYIHSLPRLSKLLAQLQITLPPTPYRLGDLTEYAVSLRYDEPPEAFEPDIPKLVETVEIILQFAEAEVNAKLSLPE